MNTLAAITRLWVRGICLMSGAMLGVMLMVAMVQPDVPIVVTCESVQFTHYTAEVCTPVEHSPWSQTDPVIGEWVWERDAATKYREAVEGVGHE